MLKYFSAPLGISAVESEGCYALPFKMEGCNEQTLCQRLLQLMSLERLTAEDLMGPHEALANDKYDPLIPSALLRKAYATDRLDLQETKKRLEQFLSEEPF